MDEHTPSLSNDDLVDPASVDRAATAAGAEAARPEVPLGSAMPLLPAVPLLAPSQRVVEAGRKAPRHSRLGQGLVFEGQAALDGSLTVAGEWQGNISLHTAPDGQVTVTETGKVVGDIRSRHISVLGQTAGVLDAAGGSVSLHSTARVDGRIRYAHLQVNGADLNAQLERVRDDDQGPAGR